MAAANAAACILLSDLSASLNIIFISIYSPNYCHEPFPSPQSDIRCNTQHPHTNMSHTNIHAGGLQHRHRRIIFKHTLKHSRCFTFAWWFHTAVMTTELTIEEDLLEFSLKKFGAFMTFMACMLP